MIRVEANGRNSLFRRYGAAVLKKLAALCALTLGPFGACLAQDDFFIKDYFVDINVKESGVFTVTEIIHVYFNYPRRGLIRDIPLQYKVSSEVSGRWLDRFFPHELEISAVSVKNHPFALEQQGTGIRIRIGDPNVYLEKDQIYEIQYSIANGVLHRKEFSEFYWNLIGDFWDQEIRHSGFKVRFPAGTPLKKEDVAVYTGRYGSKNQFTSAKVEGSVVEGEVSEMLGRGMGLTLAVRLPKGVVKEMPWHYGLWTHVKFGLIPLLAFALFGYSWWRFGRDSRLAKTVAYLPPKHIDSALAGYSIDLKAHQRDVLSLIPYFGAKGYLKLETQSGGDMVFYKLQDLPADAPPHQKIFFEGLFESGPAVNLSALKNRFYTTLAHCSDSIKDAALNSDYFTPQSVKVYRRSLYLLIIGGVLNAAYCVFNGRIVFAVITVAVIAVLVLINYILLKRSQLGDEIFLQVRGFRQFIKLAERDKLNFLLQEDPQYFDKTLPYAVAFGLTEEWTHKFAGLALQPPKWYGMQATHYSAHGGFNASDFERAMNDSLSEMRSVMSSQPAGDGASWSSGGGGGGFSGGGFGGGGGSSW